MARLTRAETLTNTNFKIEYYSDFVTSFAKTPYGDQLAKVKNENSINQALRNLILTNPGDRPFQPFIGSGVMASLFENNTPENLHSLEFYIENSIKNYEPRVNLIDVQASSVDDNENEVTVSISYNTINNPEPTIFNFILKRVR